jgi:MscS family membrane protein
MVLFVALCGSTGAAASPLLPELDVSTPRATYETFLTEARRIEAMLLDYRANPTLSGQRDLARAMQRLVDGLFDLSGYAPSIREKIGFGAAGYLADILRRLPAPPTDSGTDPQQARWSVPGTEIRIVRIAEGPRAGDHVFSADTVDRLPGYHAQIIGSPLLQEAGVGDMHARQEGFVGPLFVFMRSHAIPEPLKVRILQTPAWKVILSVLIIALVAWIVSAWARIVQRFTAQASALRRRLAWLTVPGLLAALVAVANFVISWQVVVFGLFAAAEIILATLSLYVAAAWAAWLLCWVLVEWIIDSPAIPDDSYDAHLLRLLARVASPIAAGVFVVLGLNQVGVPALGLLAGVSIGGIALALAAQSTVENLLGGIAIFADRPFRVGDFVRYGSASGTVEAIGPRSTRLRGLDGTLTTVPNGDLAKMHLTNVTTRSHNLFQNRLALPADTPLAALADLLSALRTCVAAHPLVEVSATYPRIRLLDPTETGLSIEVTAYVRTTSFAEFLRTEEALMIEILRTLEEHIHGSGVATRPSSKAAHPNAVGVAALSTP